MSITIGQGITFGTGSSSITYWANYTGTDFVYFPTSPDPWGIYYWATGSYLEITLSAWSNSSAFNNLLTVSSGSVLQLDPAGYGSLINFTSTSGWVSQGNGVYRMTGTWAFGGPTFDSGITNFKFTYVSTTFLGGITLTTGESVVALPSGYVTLAGLTWAPMTTGGTYAESQTYAANFTGLGFPAGTWRSATPVEIQNLTQVLSYADAQSVYGWVFSVHPFNIWSSQSGQIVNFATGANPGTSNTNRFNFLVCKTPA